MQFSQTWASESLQQAKSHAKAECAEVMQFARSGTAFHCWSAG